MLKDTWVVSDGAEDGCTVQKAWIRAQDAQLTNHLTFSKSLIFFWSSGFFFRKWRCENWERRHRKALQNLSATLLGTNISELCLFLYYNGMIFFPEFFPFWIPQGCFFQEFQMQCKPMKLTVCLWISANRQTAWGT